jgi:integrase
MAGERVSLHRGERAWLLLEREKEGGTTKRRLRDDYVALKTALGDHVRRLPMGERAAEYLLGRSLAICRALLDAGVGVGVGHEGEKWGLLTLHEATVRSALSALQGPGSLRRLRRVSRADPEAGDTGGRRTVLSYVRAAAFLHGPFWSLPGPAPCAERVWCDVRSRLPAAPVDVGIDGPPDALSTEEMDRVLAACVDPRERAIIVLLARLGMRIGAARNLRLAGVLPDVPPGPGEEDDDDGERWRVRRYIHDRTRDKKKDKKRPRAMYA